MKVTKLRQHRKKFDGVAAEQKKMRGVFNVSKVVNPDVPVTLPRVGGPTLEEIEAKYGPVSKMKPQGQRS